MDIVVVDIPPEFGMLLSRSWASKLKGTLQMDMSYATIPLFGQHRRLYRVNILEYVVISQEKPYNRPIMLLIPMSGIQFSIMISILKRIFLLKKTYQ